MPWSPLAYGLRTGKYDRASVEAASPEASGLPRDAAPLGEERPPDDKRLDGANPFGGSNVTALGVSLTAEQCAALDAVSTPRMLYTLFSPGVRRQVVFGGSPVEPSRS